jgi:hypothetical protein
MKPDSNVQLLAKSLFDGRLQKELRPARRKMRREVRIRFAPAAAKVRPGSYERALVKIESQLAKDAMVARAESLLRAHQQAGRQFDEDAFRYALKDVREHLDRYSCAAYRMIVKEVHRTRGHSDEDLERTIARLLQRSVERIFNGIFEMLAAKRDESLLQVKACRADVA